MLRSIAFTAACLSLLTANRAIAQQTTAELVEATTPAVVMITVETGEGFKSGSGFVVESDGLIVTNSHVISGAKSAAVKMSSGDVFDDVRIMAEDTRRDLAVLKISAFGLPTLRWGNSDSIPVGTDIIAIGSPLGLENTVSTGIVSAFRQYEGYRLMQISAPISHGSSGGPILDKAGAVVGVAVAGTEEGQNLNFAVPANYARGLIATTSDVPLAQLTKLSQPDGVGSSGLAAVNQDLPELTDFQDFGYEYEVNLGNGYKLKQKTVFTKVLLPDSVARVEATSEEIGEYKSAPLASSQTVRTSTSRVGMRLPDLSPVSAFVNISAWNGSQWETASRQLQFEDGWVNGTSLINGNRQNHRIPIPTGVRLSKGLSVASVMADSMVGRTISLTTFAPETLQLNESLITFKGFAELKEADRKFRVMKMDLVEGANRWTAYYNAEFPPYLVRIQGTGGMKGKIKKVLQ